MNSFTILLLGLIMGFLGFACKQAEDSSTKSLTSETTSGNGVNLLIWSKNGNYISGGKPVRCYYYKEHPSSVGSKQAHRTSVSLNKHPIADNDLIEALHQVHKQYFFDTLEASVPFTGCGISGGFKIADCLKYLANVGYKEDKAYAIGYAIESIRANMIDYKQKKTHGGFLAREYTPRVEELEIRELVKTIKKFPQAPQFGTCPKSNVAFDL
ncbi:MAG: hypothetical protein HRU19_23285 [Pseudobacteriovorax sp.]|nr:hypothetical protein [Pseudobacteriovorax sp.]